MMNLPLSKALANTQERLGKPYHDLEFVLLAFHEVLIENGEPDIAAQIPWINDSPIIPSKITGKHLQLYSIIFHLINMVEINGAVQHRRAKEGSDLKGVNGLWAANFHALKSMGITDKQMADHMRNVYVEPVLTAHPTEAKRATVLEHHRELYILLVQLENSMFSKQERENIRHNIKQSLYRLWKTGEIYLEKPDVESELRNVIHYLVNVFPDAIPIMDRRMIQAWQDAGFDKNDLLVPFAFPHLSFGDWVGGDRDGHPLVTAAITERTLLNLRLHAFVVIKRKLSSLLQKISFSCELEETSPGYKSRLYQMVHQLGDKGVEALNRNKGEAFRQMLNLMITKLPVESERGHATKLAENPGSYVHSSQLIEDLKLLQQELVNYGAVSTAYDEVVVAIRIVETFGFHLAALDIRQNSAFHDKAVQQLLAASGVAENDFSKWDETRRLKFLNDELKTTRPFTHPQQQLDTNAHDVINCFRTVKSHTDKYGTNCIGYCIVSMTRSLSDLLTVYLFQREVGLTLMTPDGLCAALPVVPLFETIDDLEMAPDVLAAFLDHPVTKLTLAQQRDKDAKKRPIQTVMIGYSDSNKDGGIMASLWNLHKAQYKLKQIGLERGIDIRFFHGKGGSISRGAGPTHYFIDSLPHQAIKGGLRLTEQGETIAQKYANRVNAAYNLELLCANAMAKSLRDEVSEGKFHSQAQTLEFLSSESCKKYEELINEGGFIPFFRTVTPIDAIETSKIGSRPAKRTGASTLQDLRAIPWVFSWTQARFNITSWFGLGHALEQLKIQRPADYHAFHVALKHDAFIRYVLTNVDTALASTSTEVMKLYSELLDDAPLREKFMGLIFGEYDRLQKHFAELLGKPVAERRPAYYYSNQLRSSMLEYLHIKQVELLKTWRKAKAENAKEVRELHTELMLTINAIAGAIQNTG